MGEPSLERPNVPIAICRKPTDRFGNRRFPKKLPIRVMPNYRGYLYGISPGLGGQRAESEVGGISVPSTTKSGKESINRSDTSSIVCMGFTA